MKKEYVTFVSSLEDLAEGRESELFIRDLTPGPRKYNGKLVKAIMSSAPEQLPDGDILWVRSVVGVLYPQPWTIKVIEELGAWIPGHPHQGIVSSSS